MRGGVEAAEMGCNSGLRERESKSGLRGRAKLGRKGVVRMLRRVRKGWKERKYRER